VRCSASFGLLPALSRRRPGALVRVEPLTRRVILHRVERGDSSFQQRRYFNLSCPLVAPVCCNLPPCTPAYLSRVPCPALATLPPTPRSPGRNTALVPLSRSTSTRLLPALSSSSPGPCSSVALPLLSCCRTHVARRPSPVARRHTAPSPSEWAPNFTCLESALSVPPTPPAPPAPPLLGKTALLPPLVTPILLVLAQRCHSLKSIPPLSRNAIA
jgi:hypothetical protein